MARSSKKRKLSAPEDPQQPQPAKRHMTDPRLDGQTGTKYHIAEDLLLDCEPSKIPPGIKDVLDKLGNNLAEHGNLRSIHGKKVLLVDRTPPESLQDQIKWFQEVRAWQENGSRITVKGAHGFVCDLLKLKKRCSLLRCESDSEDFWIREYDKDYFALSCAMHGFVVDMKKTTFVISTPQNTPSVPSLSYLAKEALDRGHFWQFFCLINDTWRDESYRAERSKALRCLSDHKNLREICRVVVSRGLVQDMSFSLEIYKYREDMGWDGDELPGWLNSLSAEIAISIGKYLLLGDFAKAEEISQFSEEIFKNICIKASDSTKDAMTKNIILRCPAVKDLPDGVSQSLINAVLRGESLSQEVRADLIRANEPVLSAIEQEGTNVTGGKIIAIDGIRPHST